MVRSQSVGAQEPVFIISLILISMRMQGVLMVRLYSIRTYTLSIGYTAMLLSTRLLRRTAYALDTDAALEFIYSVRSLMGGRLTF